VQLIGDLRAEWEALGDRIPGFDAEFEPQARADEAACRLTTVPGIGTINATALVATIKIRLSRYKGASPGGIKVPGRITEVVCPDHTDKLGRIVRIFPIDKATERVDDLLKR